MPAGLGHVVPLGEWQQKGAVSGSAHGRRGVLSEPCSPPPTSGRMVAALLPRCEDSARPPTLFATFRALQCTTSCLSAIKHSSQHVPLQHH